MIKFIFFLIIKIFSLISKIQNFRIVSKIKKNQFIFKS